MAFKMKHLRIDNNSRVHVRIGHTRTSIILELPTKKLVPALVRAAFGPKARIVK